jgi:Fe2+ or Zn2+ uptake regulation protein
VNLESFLTAFKTKTRVRICVVIGDEELTLSQIFEKYKFKYNENPNRETIYRGLENLVKYDIIEKRYDKKTKLLYYSLKVKGGFFDFVKNEIRLNYIGRSAREEKIM